MATTMSNQEAIKRFNVRLLQELPLENHLFMAMANDAGLFPLGTQASINAQGTRQEKVAFLLNHVVEPGADIFLPRLLAVMDNDPTATRLAEDIRAATGLGTYNIMQLNNV